MVLLYRNDTMAMFVILTTSSLVELQASTLLHTIYFMKIMMMMICE